MGRAKERMMEIEAQGYNCVVDKRICHCCVDDYALSYYIKNHGTRRKCNYCNGIRKSISFEDLCVIVVNNIRKVYTRPIDDLYYDKEDPTGFLGGTELGAVDTYDLINSLGCFDADVCEDLTSCLSDEFWCYDPYEVFDSRYDDAWHEFCQRVKSGLENIYNMQVSNDGFNIEEYDFFEKLIEMIHSLNMVKSFPKSVVYYRARTCFNRHDEWKGIDMGSPPPNYAKNNRMSIKGESVFYGALDKNTCTKEVLNDDEGFLHLGEFKATRKLLLLDLSRVKPISIFDEEKNKLLVLKNLEIRKN